MASMMEQYKDLWISGHATPGYPAGLNLTPGATVLYQRPDNSLVGLTKLDVRNFAFEDREVTELIGLELARLIVDTCYPELMREREETERTIEQQSRKSPYRR
jgi:hypothetical protein